jgi:hypothetical protein
MMMCIWYKIVFTEIRVPVALLGGDCWATTNAYQIKHAFEGILLTLFQIDPEELRLAP